jgi:hypothetical protein
LSLTGNAFARDDLTSSSATATHLFRRSLDPNGHNTPPSEARELGPFDNWPTGLGLYFYGFMAGKTSQYEPRLFENNIPIEPPYNDPNYHLTVDLAEKRSRRCR